MVRPGTKLRLVLLSVALVLAGSRSGWLTFVQSVVAQTTTETERFVTARSNETVRAIANRVGVDAAELARVNQLSESSRVPKGTKLQLPPEIPAKPDEQNHVVGNRITLSDGYSFEADEVWKQGDDIWYRQGNITRVLKTTVKSVRPMVKSVAPEPATNGPPSEKKEVVAEALPTWIYLVGGARFRVDSVNETSDGAWYTRDKISIFLERNRIARIEVEQPKSANLWRGTDWTSGNAAIDHLIRTNGAAFGVDPYLVFLVIEKESRFQRLAVSPKGARGLMQLMPGTARRFGCKKPFDPAENIRAGTQYLRELMDRFAGQVNLVLASYNAGEGAVIKYGRQVPPYRETRDYVRTIGKRYGLSGREKVADDPVPPPQR